MVLTCFPFSFCKLQFLVLPPFYYAVHSFGNGIQEYSRIYKYRYKEEILTRKNIYQVGNSWFYYVSTSRERIIKKNWGTKGNYRSYLVIPMCQYREYTYTARNKVQKWKVTRQTWSLCFMDIFSFIPRADFLLDWLFRLFSKYKTKHYTKVDYLQYTYTITYNRNHVQIMSSYC